MQVKFSKVVISTWRSSSCGGGYGSGGGGGVGGGGGGRGGGGGSSNNFNITVNASGITDRSDKRQLAREIGNMIQQEMSRSIGGTTMRGRYS